MAEHTSTPWIWRDVAGAGLEICAPIGGQIKGMMQPGYENHPVKVYQLVGPATVQIACERWVQFEPEGWATMQKANAAFIVRAVNSHDALVKALEEARSCIEDLGAGKGGWAWEEVVQQIHEALALSSNDRAGSAS